MFQLEEAISQWKSSQRYSGESLDATTLDELECHLRDQIDAFREKGCLNDEEAYLLALRRLGDPDVLNREFLKQGVGLQWTRRIFWILAGYLGISSLIAIASATGVAVRTIAVLVSSESAPVAAAVMGATVTLLMGIGLCLFVARLLRKDEATSFKITRYLREHPVVLVVGAGLILAGKGAFLSGASMYLVRQVSMKTMGSLSLVSSMSWAVVNVLFFLVMAISMVVLRRRGWRHQSANS